jgi:hypothetical protein
MCPATAPRPPSPTPVQVVVEDVPDLDERVRDAARQARARHRPVELVEPFVAECDHAARAELIRRMDAALDVARRAAPGVEVRVGPHVGVPRPRGAP